MSSKEERYLSRALEVIWRKLWTKNTRRKEGENFGG
jgi:hypothetical protein